MIKKTKVTYTVYQIIINKEVLYIGRTLDILRRQNEHNRNLSTEKPQLIYNRLKELGVTKVTLTPFKTGLTKVESKRLEIYLILTKYFNNETLYQRIPCIMDSYK